MSSITNVNNNSSVVNVGRTTPVTPGIKTTENSIPVVIASDQDPIPVVEQNAIKSEVSLSLLGIPRAEVALGIFADVNTYDVNPSEWSSFPVSYINGYGIKHLPDEAGALVEAPRNNYAILTSKRFFRYQPGRVSSATFGIKSTVSDKNFAQNPIIKKYGIYDNFDGYYWETREDAKGDNFAVVRRTQSLFKSPASSFGNSGDELRHPDFNANPSTISFTQTDDYRFVGHPPQVATGDGEFIKTRKIITNNKFVLIENSLQTANLDYAQIASELSGEDADSVEEKCKRDLEYWIDMFLFDLENDAQAHTKINTYNYDTAVLANTANEVAVHEALKDELTSIVVDSTANTAVSDLCDIAIDFFNTETNPVINDSDYGNKSKVDTLFDARKGYWSYVVSEKNANGESISYDGYSSFTAEEVKYKCQRDVQYIIEGYRDDISGGGNAATKYNASMYYKGNGLSIGSQSNTSLTLVEIERHEYLQDLILTDLQNTFSFAEETSTRFQELSNIIINNFNEEDTSSVVYGTRGVPGNLIALRDKLLVTHAAIYDPSLLKERKKIRAQLNSTDNTSKIVEGQVTFGQHVTYYGPTNGDLTDGKIYKVKSVIGPKGNEFTLVDENGGNVSISTDDLTAAYFQIVNPFIFPDEYNPNNYTPNDYVEGAMFPYAYKKGGDPIQSSTSSQDTIGYINTAKSNTNEIRQEIDNVNFIPEYINWIKNNVKPEYYGVYEYRVPRSRYSNDPLNGEENQNIVYSDFSTSGGQNYPGTTVVENNNPLTVDSVYDFDFTKVTMLKIEFSWYGAVGALFLAYVPVENGEARWVRIHHLRASNQLKAASLGNATLPITYNVWGGGDENQLGYDNSNFTQNNYNNTKSHYLVKYGASYYIDGGDRGTVRLYNHTNETPVDARGSKYTVGSVSLSNSTDFGFEDLLEFNRATNTDGFANEFFMGAKVQTNSANDQNIFVVWTTDSKIYLSTKNTLNNNNITLIPNRKNSIYGLETKQSIVSTQGNVVRNRIQVYPTNISAANLGEIPIKLEMRKNPIFQVDTSVSGNFYLDEEYEITVENLPLTANSSSSDYLEEDGDFVYGWFRVRVENENQTAFGRLYREASEYYFELLESFTGRVFILPNIDFLYDPIFDSQGGNSVSRTTTEKENLSSIVIANQTQVPIPNTGSNIATIFLGTGTEQLELDTYFDYNKEYLSFPLVNQKDTLYFLVDTNEDTSNTTSISLSSTWEEQ